MPVLFARGLAVLALLFPTFASAQFVSVLPAGAVEDFDTLTEVGTTDDVLPDGWFLFESDDNADTSYRIGNGSGNQGDTYSFGATGSSERAFGGLLSGSLVPTIGANLRNDTGGMLSELPIAYVGEQWRLGTAGREDRLDFQYSLDATSLDTGTWIDVDELDFMAPVTDGSTGPLDGNLPTNSVAISGSLTGLSLAANASLWIRWSDFNGSGADDGLAIDDIVFGTPEDLQPVLMASTPNDGANDFPADGSLSLQFSEAVNVTGAWFEIVCSVSGTRAIADTAVGVGPITYNIDPLIDFDIGETCTLTLDPTLIADLDAPIDQYVGDTTIVFTTIAPPPNEPPAVTATYPLAGTDTFPSAGTLGATFSEPVTLGPGAFALVCSETDNIVLAYGSSGTVFSIDTGTALVPEESCTFTIDADAVSDAQGANPIGNTVVVFAVGSNNPSAYYAQVNTSSPAQLRCSLHEIIDDHTAYPYSTPGTTETDTWDILNLADEDPMDSGTILDAYRNESYTKITGGVGAYNREHTWPNSLGFDGDDPGGGGPGPFTDTHMLYLTNSGYNTERSNSPYDNCSGCEEWVTVANHGAGGGSGVYPGNSNWSNNSIFEVWGGRKGDMARAVMYMAIRYEGDNGEPDLELTDSQALIDSSPSTSTGPDNPAYMGMLTTLIEWHQGDLPDQREIERNEVIFDFQGNRNPFIDHPEWGTEALFTSVSPADCVLSAPNLPPVANDDAYPAVEDTQLVIAAPGVLANDTDPEDASLTAQLVADVQHGTLALAANGGFTYTPAANYCGGDGFTYRASDGTLTSSIASVAITVACVNDAPAANDATFIVAENSGAGTLVGTVAANDPDSGDTLAFAIVSGNGSGAFAVDANGQITVLDPAALDFEITPQFVLDVTVSDDGTPMLSDTASITINLGDVDETPPNQAPVADGTLDDSSAVEGSMIEPRDLSLPFSDPDGDALTFTADNLPDGLVLDPASGMLFGTPGVGAANGSPYLVTISASDGSESVSLQFTLTVTEAPPLPDAIFADGFED